MNMISFKTILTFRLEFSHLFKVFILESIYCMSIYYCYAIFSMLIFGEGSNSFMYTITNGFIYLGLIILPPTILNIYKLINHYKNGLISKSKSYLVTQVILTFGFLWLVFVIAPVQF